MHVALLTFFNIIPADLDKKFELYDFEAIAEEILDPLTGKSKIRRLVAFGEFAGIAASCAGIAASCFKFYGGGKISHSGNRNVQPSL